MLAVERLKAQAHAQALNLDRQPQAQANNTSMSPIHLTYFS
jgi:hypothetical protein